MYIYIYVCIYNIYIYIININIYIYNKYIKIYIYIYMVSCSVFLHPTTPPNGMGPQVAPPSLLFASYWQHF